MRDRDVEASDKLVVRNHFYRARTTGARGCVYRPGDTLWARFDITATASGEAKRSMWIIGLHCCWDLVAR